MKGKPVITALLCLHCTWACAQVTRPYKDPDDIRLSDKESINVAVKQSFSIKELCLMRKGYIIFSCKLNSQGKITSITTEKAVSIEMSIPKAQQLKKRIMDTVIFHVPSELKTKETSRFRKASIVIPFKGYCK
jgi:hypothetical protein